MLGAPSPSPLALLLPPAATLSRTARPASSTVPTTVYSGGSWVSTKQRKNWLPVVLGSWVFAMAIVPLGYVVSGLPSWPYWYGGPPLPVRVGPPHCRTPKCGWLTSRWQGLPSKNF